MKLFNRSLINEADEYGYSPLYTVFDEVYLCFENDNPLEEIIKHLNQDFQLQQNYGYAQIIKDINLIVDN